MVTWQHIRISRFGGPEVLELVEETSLPQPGSGEVRIKVLAAGAGFTDTFIRRGRYPDFKGPLPFTPGYDLVGLIDAVGPDVGGLAQGDMVADLCVVGGYTQFAIRPAQALVRIPESVDPTEAVAIPLTYLTAFQMLNLANLSPSDTILVIGASGAVGTALLDLARHRNLAAIGTCSARNIAMVERLGATAIDYGEGDFVAKVRSVTASRETGIGVEAVFDAIGGDHFSRSFKCLKAGGILIGYGAQTMATGATGLASAALGLARLKFWNAFSFALGNRRARFYSITAERSARPAAFKSDMAALFKLLADRSINPIIVDRRPLADARQVHERIDAGGVGGKIVLVP